MRKKHYYLHTFYGYVYLIRVDTKNRVSILTSWTFVKNPDLFKEWKRTGIKLKDWLLQGDEYLVPRNKIIDILMDYDWKDK